ncbi:MAG: 2-oxoglutarate ferredoxin oxidoreductase subunit gamma [Nitrospinae bacterium RIFCSPLOWO2_02_39_17]|nr:MAG: 2-oxoglutarate ferredoxin oxidoreductase subunit gamma [Nitrospinae bacterium RIFCSPHIGHO2_02_39_11]OGW01302.1 MAG: 2-oxoglutarate ferredoxin oxidoreductase subunit gamma [Nitrospinae bacterium RIFCSPLOWO2_02_39_17]OGW11191.1 MAG: 2-oxoglutarate ferredoxin oxidoreductase subunit gamma [Nitrospinae bacterium RIFCSPLOWO2_12_39_15]
MSYRYEMRFSGSGGQGMILAGIIMAEAASIYDGKNASQSQSYGPESRGGASRSEVIISDEDIDYPKATSIDAMLAMTQEACNKYHKDIKREGILLIDSTEVKKLPQGDFKIYSYPISEIARDELGKVIVANIISLGMIVELTKIVSHEAIEQAVLARVPPAFLDLNKKALQIGFERARDLKPLS